jgi:hypothetical protein
MLVPGTRNDYTYSINNLDALRQKIVLAIPLPAVGDLARMIDSSEPLQKLYKNVEIQAQTYSDLLGLAQRIDIYIEAIVGVILSSGVGAEDGNEVSIKLPKASQLSNVVEALSRIDKIFSQAMSVLPESPAVNVKRWENGSLWIDMLVGSASGVVLIGGLTWAAACAFKKYQEGRLLEKMTDSLGLKNDLLAVLRDGVDKAVNEIIDAEAKRLDAKHSKGKGDVETIGRLQFCIRELYEMIRVGTEVHPSLLAPEDVRNVFPNMEEVLGLPSTQKLLTQHGENQEESSVKDGV